jgi:hypothetical protein
MSGQSTATSEAYAVESARDLAVRSFDAAGRKLDASGVLAARSIPP